MFDAETSPRELVNFVSFKLNIQGCSPKTVYEYHGDLRNFLKYYLKKKTHSQPPMEDIDISPMTVEDFAKIQEADIYDYLLYTADQRRNMPASRARKLAAIRAFFRYLCNKKHLLQNNPAKDIGSPKVRQALPKFLDINESKALLSAVQAVGKENKERDYCILLLFLNCGMRLNELCGIGLSSISNDLTTVKVLGKGSKERILYVNDSVRQALADYLKVRAHLSCHDKDALFVSRNKRRLSDKAVQLLVKKYLAYAGLGGKGYSTHKLRHTAATLMYGTGQVDVRVLKDILGHEQLNTTQIYTHVSSEQMKQATALHPLANIDKKDITPREDDE